MSGRAKQLTADTINDNMKNCRYEVRGEIYLAGVKRSKEGKEVINLNVGNPQALGQKPLTFNRQVMALLMAPFLMENEEIIRTFPPDAVARAKLYLKNLNGGLGAYSDSKGNPFIRQEIANFIENETGMPSSADNIFLSNGASECARMLLAALIRGPTDGIMVPIPQYPLYSASIALYGGELVPYYLDEENGWVLDIDELQKSFDAARAKVSKGAYGECGLRGGYMELLNFDDKVIGEIYKVASINLCPNVPGQVALGLMVNPPRIGDPSFELYKEEKASLIESLKRRAIRITNAFNSLEGVLCQPTDGAMYSFPRITLPPAAVNAARERGKAPDVLYCLELLEETGLSCVPGSGFRQLPGTFHLRTTILPPEDLFDKIIEKFSTFHNGFLRRYSGSSGIRAKL
eukprot:gene2477-1808_t